MEGQAPNPKDLGTFLWGLTPRWPGTSPSQGSVEAALRVGPQCGLVLHPL